MHQHKMWDAIDLLRRYGWTKRALHNLQDEYCLLGAVNESGGSDYYEIYTLALTIREMFPDRVGYLRMPLPTRPSRVHVWAFNDHALTTEEEVLSVMEKAAIKLDEAMG